jgi:hypothetical protein
LHTYCPEPAPAWKNYNEDVRYYTTKPANGGTTFKCTFCEQSVSTLDFSSANGNRRTQAAAAINQHVAMSHLPAPVPNQFDRRGAL